MRDFYNVAIKREARGHPTVVPSQKTYTHKEK